MNVEGEIDENAIRSAAQEVLQGDVTISTAQTMATGKNQRSSFLPVWSDRKASPPSSVFVPYFTLSYNWDDQESLTKL